MLMSEGPPNNSFNRSANSIAFMRETMLIMTLFPRPVNSGVRRLVVFESQA
jgi:hypothetical protein